MLVLFTDYGGGSDVGGEKKQRGVISQIFSLSYCVMERQGFLGGAVVKNLPADAGDAGSIPGLGRSSIGGNGHPLQYSCDFL